MALDLNYSETPAEKEQLDDEERLPAVAILNDLGELEPMRIMRGKYVPEREAKIFFQQRKIYREMRILEKIEMEGEREEILEKKRRKDLSLNAKAKKSLNFNKQKNAITHG